MSRPGVSGGDISAGVLVAATVAVSGILFGLAWYVLAPTLPLRVLADGRLAYLTTGSPEQQVAADAWFAILGFSFGVLAAVGVWLVAHRWRGPVQLVAVVLGTVLGAALAWQMGIRIDRDAYEASLASAAPESVVQRPIELTVTSGTLCLPQTNRCTEAPGGSLLVPALGATMAYALLAGWSHRPGLRRGEDEADDVAGFNWGAEEALADQVQPAPRESP